MKPCPLALDHIVILVRSLDRSLPFYSALLPLLGYRNDPPDGWTDDRGFRFQFAQANAGTADYQRHAPGLNHLGFGAPSAECVHKVRDAMVHAGFDIPEAEHIGGAIALFMADPDGLRFELTYSSAEAVEPA